MRQPIEASSSQLKIVSTLLPRIIRACEKILMRRMITIQTLLCSILYKSDTKIVRTHFRSA